MIYCKKCGAALPDGSAFCSNCGNPVVKTNLNMDMPTPEKNENTQSGAKIAVFITCSCVALVLLGLLLALFWPEGDSDQEKDPDHGAATGVAVVTATAAGNLKFTAESYEIPTNEETDMSRYLQQQGVEADNLVWSSNSDDLVAGSNGRVVIKEPGINSVLTVKDKTNPKVEAHCALSTRSGEDDLSYEIQGLNGDHTQDETNDQGVVKLASTAQEDYEVDLKKQVASPALHSNKYKWNKKLFYTLEDVSKTSDKDGTINSYKVEKKQFKNAETQKPVEYEIYRQPDTNVINKVVSIEQKDKILNIVEYYFTDKGKVNFIFEHQDVNYVPDYAYIERKGQRFLFCKDSLVTWRVVDKKGERNYCYGKAEKNRLQGHKGVKEYHRLSDKKRQQYDSKEQEMLNAAYNTLNKVSNYSGVSSIRGYVKDEDNNGMSDATVQLKSTDQKTEMFQKKTDEDGYYEILVPARENNYQMEFQKDTYHKEQMYHVDADTDQIGMYQESVCLAPEGDQKYTCNMRFFDAVLYNEDGIGMQPLNGVHIWVRSGVNNREGNVVYEAENIDDACQVDLQAGMYTVQIRCYEHEDSYHTMYVSSKQENNPEFFSTPSLAKGQIRIVLTWNDNPKDLDSHLFAPSAVKKDQHICYYNKTSVDGSTELDVDEVNGYGPETTTIYKMKKGQYKFYVADFTNCSRNNEESYEMSNSQATIRVYNKKGLIQTFFVPVNRKGVIWEVFEIRNGNVIPSQHYYDAIGNKTWWSSQK